MHLPTFTHQQPTDFGGVVSALTEASGAKLLAGGTDLLVNMKHRIEMPEMESIHIDTDDPLGPFGAKEAGEGTQPAPAPAIVNASADAIGLEFHRLPVTPAMILSALRKKQGKARGAGPSA